MPHVDTPQSRCRFSIAVCDITPPVGCYHRMWGAATHDRSEGIHRPLLATIAWISPAANSAGADESLWLVALDHCLLGVPEMDFFFDIIRAEAAVPRERIAVAFSHTHGAGLMNFDRRELPGGDLIEPYIRDMAKKVAHEIHGLKSQPPTEATIVYGTARCDLAVQRDFWDDKSQQFVCGYNPRESADDTVIVGRVTSVDGRTLATLVNYACHPTTLAWENKLVSPDYIGALREVVEQATGAPCVFLQGASGELGPKEGYVGDPAVADRNGRQLAYAALSSLVALPKAGTRFVFDGPVVSGATLGAWSHQPVPAERLAATAAWRNEASIVPLRYRPSIPTLAQTRANLARWQQDEAAAHAAGDELRARDCHAMVERETRLIARLSSLPAGDAYPFPLRLVRMGDAVWVFVIGEHYSLLQRELRRRFPGTPLIVCTLTNGWGPSYLPTSNIYGRGIYQESIALLEAGCLEHLIDAIAEKLGRVGG